MPKTGIFGRTRDSPGLEPLVRPVCIDDPMAVPEAKREIGNMDATTCQEKAGRTRFAVKQGLVITPKTVFSAVQGPSPRWRVRWPDNSLGW
jgi:hypothetical protein